MAWTAPKVDWASVDGVAYTDLNEIGENLVYLKAHADATTGIHGAVSAATVNTLIIRDAAGRAKVVAPSAEDDIALKSNVTAEATARANADAAQDVTIANLGTDKVEVAGDTMTGPLIGDFPDTDYTTAMFRNIKLLTAVPGAGDLDNGEIAFVYEV
jgi:RNase P/RNase MRP subunit p29